MKKEFRSTADIASLKQRAELLRKTRNFFDDRGFFEVETPILSHDIVVDRFLEPIEVSGKQLGVESESGSQFWMQTSPEFGMKRLLASGADAIYQICKCFRAGERGALHNPEFTMLEWYRVGDDMKKGIELLSKFVETILSTPNCEVRSYAEVFQSCADCNVLTENVSTLKENAAMHGLDTSTFENCDDLDQWRNLILTHVVEPRLGRDGPVIVYDWPASQSALAIVREDSPPIAERFELYYQGVELANGYHELLDPKELGKRNESINRLRQLDGKTRLPNDSRLLEAMRYGLPSCSGVALGIDRLAMLATKCNAIDQVIAFPIELS